MKDMLKLGLVLMIYSAVACVGLALVNTITAPKIAQVKETELNQGLKEVFTQADSFLPADGFEKTKTDGITIEGIYTAKLNGETTGVVVQATGATYDSSTILVGIDADKNITALKFLSCSDTPGFGQKATLPSFTDQFKGKTAVSNFELKKDFDQVSGATITSKGVAAILKSATTQAIKYLPEAENE